MKITSVEMSISFRRSSSYPSTAFDDYYLSQFQKGVAHEVDVTLVENVSTNAVGILARADENGDNGYKLNLKTKN